jgi:hypothetical protein
MPEPIFWIIVAIIAAVLTLARNLKHIEFRADFLNEKSDQELRESEHRNKFLKK